MDNSLKFASVDQDEFKNTNHLQNVKSQLIAPKYMSLPNAKAETQIKAEQGFGSPIHSVQPGNKAAKSR